LDCFIVQQEGDRARRVPVITPLSVFSRKTESGCHSNIQTLQLEDMSESRSLALVTVPEDKKKTNSRIDSSRNRSLSEHWYPSEDICMLEY